MLLRAECFFAICAARVAMRFFASPAIARAMRARVTRVRNTDAHAIASIFADVVARHPVSTNCLHRALALHFVLVRRGVDAQFRIGIRREAPHFPGHAWVEAAGVALNEGCALRETYAELVTA